MKLERRKAKVIKIGNIKIGGGHPIAIQSMAKAETKDYDRVIKQIKQLQRAGCDIVRVAVKDKLDARALKKIKSGIGIALVADIHFDWRLAIEAIDNGADKIRLNPGNIYNHNQIREIAKAAKLSGIPIRVGLNSGSIRSPKGLRQKEKKPVKASEDPAGAMVKSCLDYIKTLESFGFYDIIVSLKASNVIDTVNAYLEIAERCDYPLHLGVTATGLPASGVIKSSIAIGSLLLEGIGDTIRVSLTDEPAQEVKIAKLILAALGLNRLGPDIISCPTCGRCEVDLIKIIKDLENKLDTCLPPACRTGRDRQAQYSIHNTRPIKVAVMGCVVNGPGEAKEADIGVAFGKKEGLLFKNGRPIKKVPYDRCVGVLLKEIFHNRVNA